jgi:hypothetical protein
VRALTQVPGCFLHSRWQNLPEGADARRAASRAIRMDEELTVAGPVCRALGIGVASKKRNSNHTTEYVSRLDLLSAVSAQNPR